MEQKDAALLLDMLEAKYKQTRGEEESKVETDTSSEADPLKKLLVMAHALDYIVRRCRNSDEDTILRSNFQPKQSKCSVRLTCLI